MTGVMLGSMIAVQEVPTECLESQVAHSKRPVT